MLYYIYYTANTRANHRSLPMCHPAARPPRKYDFPTGTGRAHDTALLCKWLAFEMRQIGPHGVVVWQLYNHFLGGGHRPYQIYGGSILFGYDNRSNYRISIFMEHFHCKIHQVLHLVFT